MSELSEEDSEDSPEMVAEIQELCTKPGKKFHVYRTGNGEIDAQINYNAAKAHILKQKLSAPKPKNENPLKGAKPIAPLGDSPTSTSKAKEVKLVKVDAASKRMAQHFGLDLASLGYEA
jgi:hypothetical protein